MSEKINESFQGKIKNLIKELENTNTVSDESQKFPQDLIDLGNKTAEQNLILLKQIITNIEDARKIITERAFNELSEEDSQLFMNVGKDYLNNPQATPLTLFKDLGESNHWAKSWLMAYLLSAALKNNDKIGEETNV